MGFSRGPKVVRDGLILCLDAANPKSYPGSGTTWSDTITGFEASLVNSPVYSPSDNGSFIFDGTNDYCQVTSDGTGTFDNQSFTIESWINPDTIDTDGVIFSYDFTSHTPPYYAANFRIASIGRVLFGWNNVGTYTYTLTPTNSYVAGEWQHMVAVFTSGRQEIRINGQLISSSANSDVITYYNQEVWISRGNWTGGYTDGKIAMVKYYNRALSADEILQSYNALKPRFGL